MKTLFRIGTRGSALALAQSRQIQKRLRLRYPALRFPLVIIKTSGDEFQSFELFKKNNTGIFTKAIERQLMKKRIDIAIHSLKDLPTDLPKTLTLACFPRRADARDVLISKKGVSLSRLPKGSRVGTGSPRRKRQLHRRRPDLVLDDLRGNLDTRIRSVLKEKKYDAVVLAQAGLQRLGRYQKYVSILPADVMLPAVGQGALGLEIRAKDGDTFRLLRFLNHAKTEQAVTAERAFLRTLKGGCRVPVGIHSRIRNGRIYLNAAVFSMKTDRMLTGRGDGPILQPEAAGEALARRFLRRGAKQFLTEARNA